MVIFVWNEQRLIELPNQSNGWFKALSDEHTVSVCFGYGARSQMSHAQTEAWLAEFVQVRTAIQVVPPEIVILSADKQLHIENSTFKALAVTQILIANHYAMVKHLLFTNLSKLNDLQQYLSAANQNATKLKQRQLKRHCVTLANRLHLDYLQQNFGQPSNANCLDYTCRVLKVKSMANISHLEKYIAKMLVKQWYHYERDGLTFLSSLSHQLPIRFEYESDFDQNGLFY
ncbi:E3 ubiquitin- ligase HECTD1 isoform X2 [Brachionus plicatilis]|uniref:E3 ubiquitin-ligase HECTD1 isoform X2 n=1 Tax=Brachionus plicatilis TaxID=10195 RepID=A0A3M7P4S2_BRAPC|nr:E3 ubiquitin- ligase HECTD1 isoform X2 [Brachionus plicatilis]